MLVIPVTLAPIFVPQLHDVLVGVDEKRTRGRGASAGKAGGSSEIVFILNINFIPVEFISACSVCCRCPCSSCATGHSILCSSLGQRREDRQINKTAAKHEHRGRLQVLTVSSA